MPKTPAPKTPANTGTDLATLQRAAAEASARLSAAMNAAQVKQATPKLAPVPVNPVPVKIENEKTLSVGSAIAHLAERLLTEEFQMRLLELVEETPQCAAQDSGYTLREIRELTQELAAEVLEDMADEIHAVPQVVAMLRESEKVLASN